MLFIAKKITSPALSVFWGWKTDASTSSAQDTSTGSVQVTEDRRKKNGIFLVSIPIEKAAG